MTAEQYSPDPAKQWPAGTPVAGASGVLMHGSKAGVQAPLALDSTGAVVTSRNPAVGLAVVAGQISATPRTLVSVNIANPSLSARATVTLYDSATGPTGTVLFVGNLAEGESDPGSLIPKAATIGIWGVLTGAPTGTAWVAP